MFSRFFPKETFCALFLASAEEKFHRAIEIFCQIEQTDRAGSFHALPFADGALSHVARFGDTVIGDAERLFHLRKSLLKTVPALLRHKFRRIRQPEEVVRRTFEIVRKFDKRLRLRKISPVKTNGESPFCRSRQLWINR